MGKKVRSQGDSKTSMEARMRNFLSVYSSFEISSMVHASQSSATTAMITVIHPADTTSSKSNKTSEYAHNTDIRESRAVA